MKKIVSTLLTISFFFLLISMDSYAVSRSNVEKKTVNGQSYYIETTIVERTPLLQMANRGSSKSKTATKTTNVRDNKGNILWSVSITGTFSYNGNSAQCTSCSHQTSTSSNWTIISSSSSCSGNSATATATARRSGLGNFDMTESVTITCSSSGVIQ